MNKSSDKASYEDIELRGRLVSMWRSGASIRQIADELGIPVPTVVKVIRSLEKDLVRRPGLSSLEADVEDSAINDDALEELIPRAISGDREALDSLMCSVFMMRLLTTIAEWAWRRKKIDCDEHGRDIQDIVADRIREKIHTVTNPNNFSWRKVLKTWCFRVGRACCENVLRGKRVEERYRSAVEHEYTQRKEHGVSRVVPSSSAPSPEEELERKEQALLRRRLRLKIRRAERRVLEASAPEDVKIALLWAEGKLLREISEETGLPLPVVHRRLMKLQMTLTKEIRQVIAEELGESVAMGAAVLKVLSSPALVKEFLGGEDFSVALVGLECAVQQLRNRMKGAQVELEKEKELTRAVLAELRLS